MKRVLFVDDDAAALVALRGMVRDERLPYAARFAGSADEAAKLLEAQPFDVVVCDYALGDGTAFDVFDQAGDAACIVTTGEPDQHVAIRGMKAGAFDLLIKEPSMAWLAILPRTIEDAFEHKRRERSVRMLSHALRSIADAVYVTTLEDEIVFVNRAFCELFGWSEAEALHKKSDLLWKQRPPSDARGAPGELLDWRFDATQVTKAGDPLPVSLSRSAVRDESRRPVALVRVVRDMSAQRKAEAALREANAELEMSRAALEQLNLHDELTGLYNRREVERLLQDELARTARYGRPTSLLFVDIDQFEALAGDHGQAAGDEILRRIGVVLRDSVRALDRPARWDRERFAIVLPETAPDGAKAVADRLRARIGAERMLLVGHGGKRVNLAATASVGIACAPGHASTPEELIAAADRALHRAKTSGRNRTAAVA